MATKYLIQWKSTVNGRAGKGTKRFTQEEAERLAAELNREFPQIHHEPVPADAETNNIHNLNQPMSSEPEVVLEKAA